MEPLLKIGESATADSGTYILFIKLHKLTSSDKYN